MFFKGLMVRENIFFSVSKSLTTECVTDIPANVGFTIFYTFTQHQLTHATFGDNAVHIIMYELFMG